ncbi:fimbrial protein [Enterobacter asburiae]|uniref:fimbrial protein n=1 Tax=Enterobacter asburiae TaxID=61645 RepID=UPI0027FC3623|nr:hypothetical protein EAI6_05320 [Enterobacter asburiae]
MSKLTRAVQTFLFTAMAFAAQASQGTANPSSEFDPALTGRISMDGSIISSACDINTGDGYQEISMPGETRGHIKRTGEGEPQDFSIQLTHCALDPSAEPASWQYINIIFDGQDEDGLFRVSGNASGIALELKDSQGNVIHPGKPTPWQQSTVTNNRLDYRFTLKNTVRNLVVGDYSAIIRYRIEYF